MPPHDTLTLEAIDRALEREPENTTALATLSVLRLRLATLPWIARVMAFGAPEGSIDQAIEAAERCVARQPSVEHRLLHAKALAAAEKPDDAATVLRAAAAAPDGYPRDPEPRPEVTRLLDALDSEER